MLEHKENHTKYKFAYYIVIVCSMLMFYITKYGGVFWIKSLFLQEKFELLNRLSSITVSDPSLTLYLGFAEQNIFGPLSQVFAAIALILFSIKFMQKANFIKFFICIFCFLLVTKFEVLFFPPYGDTIGGPFVEGWWLANNNFDYVGLLKEPDYAQGGPRVYFFSIYPSYVAVFMKLFKDPKIFLPLMHIIVFCLVSAVTSMLHQLLQKVLSDKTSILTAILFILHPLVQSQVESLNMEPPCLFFIMLSAYFLIQRKVIYSSLAAFGAVLIKGTGIMACGSIAFVLLIMFVAEFKNDKKINWKYIGCIIFVLCLPFLKLFSKYFVGDAHVSAGMVGFLKGLDSFKIMSIVRWFLLSLFVYLFFIFNKFKKMQANLSVHGIMYVYCIAFFMLLLNFAAVSPRYCLSVYPFLTFCVIYSLSCFIDCGNLKSGILLVLIILSALLSYGSIWADDAKDHVVLERSLEYRNDMYLDKEIIRIIKNKYSGYKIGAPMQLAQMLGLKEMGYIEKEMDVFIYGYFCHYGGIGNFSGLANLDISKTVFIGKESDLAAPIFNVPDYPYDKSDIILDEIYYGDRKAKIFMGGVAIEKLYRFVMIIKRRHLKSLK